MDTVVSSDVCCGPAVVTGCCVEIDVDDTSSVVMTAVVVSVAVAVETKSKVEGADVGGDVVSTATGTVVTVSILLPVEEVESSVETTAVVVSGTILVDTIGFDVGSATVDNSVVSVLTDVAPVVMDTVVTVSTVVPVATVASVVETTAVVVSVFVVDVEDSEVVVTVVTSVVGGC